MNDDKSSLLSSIFGTATSLIGLGKQSLVNDAEKIKADALKELTALNNSSKAGTEQFTIEATKIQNDRDQKLAAIKIQQRKQTYLALGAIVGGLSVVAVVILLIVRGGRRR